MAVLVLLGKDLSGTELWSRSRPGREVAGRGIPGRGSKCAKFSRHERASCVPGSEGRQGAQSVKEQWGKWPKKIFACAQFGKGVGKQIFSYVLGRGINLG